ncbi:hypothetical protein Ahy_B02g057921 [Arachis hypogaea]|uniref:PB1-like domain-containing protein n=1 Tax=Arachis hypogaea TaxID=3818 RepID=A0A445ADG8_ARAHY|nr:hypothetical protein Ahy_B02g057921 [Arachis hypogaea]
MDHVVTFVYHHMGTLKRVRDGNVIYEGGLVIEIHRVNVETCNLFFVEGLFLDLGYPGYNEAYWLEPGFELGKGLRVLRTDAEVMRMCESAIKNDNIIHLYFDHPIDANPEILDDDVVSDGSSESVVEVNPPGDERETEVVNEATGEVNYSKKVVKKVRKRHLRPPPSGLSQEKRAAESEQPEGDHGEDETVNEQTHETNDDDAHVANEGANIEEPVVDELRAEELATKNVADTQTQRNERTNIRRNHLRPQPSGQRIVPGKDDEAPRVEVPNPNRADGDSGPEMYQYESDELYSLPGSDDEDKPVFPQHNPNTPFGKITLELNMEFETMEHFKAVVQKYNIQIGRQFHINSISSQEYWEHHEGLPCLPPPYKRPIGRPSKKRKKDSSEKNFGSQYNAKRRYGQITCQTCKRVGHNSRTCPERSTGAAAEEEDIDEDEAREQEANWEETMEAAHNTEPDVSTTTTTAAPPNAATTPATSSEPLPPVAARPLAPTPPTRRRGRTTRRGTTASSTTPLTPSFNVAAAPPSPAQPRVVRHAAGYKSHIPLSPTNAAGPSSGSGSMPQGPLVRPTLQAQPSATSRPPNVTRKTMAATSPATQSRFTCFIPTPSLKKKKQYGPPPSKKSASNKK